MLSTPFIWHLIIPYNGTNSFNGRHHMLVISELSCFSKNSCPLIKSLLVKSMIPSISIFSLHLLNNDLWILRGHFFPQDLLLALDLQQRGANIFSDLLSRGAVLLCKDTQYLPFFEGLIWKQIGLPLQKDILNVDVWLPKNTLNFTDPSIKWYQNNSPC